MLTVREAIRQRRSIRSFRSDPVSEESIHEMLEAARLSPSRSNRQPWRFIVVTEAEEKVKLRQICRGQAFIEQAPVVFVCCMDLAVYSQVNGRKWDRKFIEQSVTEAVSGRHAYPSYWAALFAKPELRSVFTAALANTFIAINQMALVATALGLGTC